MWGSRAELWRGTKVDVKGGEVLHGEKVDRWALIATAAAKAGECMVFGSCDGDGQRRCKPIVRRCLSSEGARRLL